MNSIPEVRKRIQALKFAAKAGTTDAIIERAFGQFEADLISLLSDRLAPPRDPSESEANEVEGQAQYAAPVPGVDFEPVHVGRDTLWP
jgi:hypothetical protein